MRMRTGIEKPSIGWAWKMLWILAGLLVVGGIGWWVMSLAPEGADMSTTYPDQGRVHIAVGSAHEPYNSNPPTSGSHYEEWAAEKFYDKAIPDEHLVHNLEHGDIWISYHPRIPGSVKEELRQFADSKVVITLREANDHDIALAAWARLDAFNLEGGVLDASRVEDFIKRYKNRGPEKVMSGIGGKEF